MREIKFRIWSAGLKEFIPLELPCLSACAEAFLDTVKGYFDEDEQEDSVEYVELQEYTGLKDKNGKEIYEGDIVNVDGRKDPHIVEFVQKESGGRFQITHPKKGKWSCFSRPVIEVIGNIYENPELLGA
jgi:uncharacterized phage protein (TIGR01671 family)